MSKKNLTRNFSVDVIRILATFMIVVAHVTVTVYERMDFFGGTAWTLSFVALTICRLGVPLFLGVSGYLLVKKERSLLENAQHTWKRILLPCLFWSMLTYLCWYLTHQHLFTLTIDSIFTSAGTAYYFLIGLAIIYLLNPGIRLLVTQASQSYLQLLLVVLAFSTVGQMTATFLGFTGPFHIFNYWFMCLFYFIYGQYYAVYLDKKQSNKWRGFSLGLFALPLLFNFAVIYAIRSTGFGGDLLWESYFGPTVLLASIGLFNLMMQFKPPALSERVTNMIGQTANACFGVYLIHSIVLDVILHATPLNPFGAVKINLLFFLITATAITIGVSFGLSFLFGQSRYTRSLLGQTK